MLSQILKVIGYQGTLWPTTMFLSPIDSEIFWEMPDCEFLGKITHEKIYLKFSLGVRRGFVAKYALYFKLFQVVGFIDALR